MIDNCANLYFFYDQTCALCVRFKGWVAQRDVTREVELLPLSEEGLQARFPMVDFTRAGKQLTECDRRGEVYEGIAVLRMLALSVPGLALLDWVYGLPGVQAVSGGIYQTVNRVRRRLCFNCGDHWMPSKKYSKRERRAGRRRRR